MQTKEIRCHDCGVKEGRLHRGDCDNEICPFCGGQLMTCNCCYSLLLLDLLHYDRYGPKTHYLPPKGYKEGLSLGQQQQWDNILYKKGRIPFIVYPNICVRCGELWPEMFRVPDDEWEHYIELGHQQDMLCLKCYNEIKTLIDRGYEHVGANG